MKNLEQLARQMGEKLKKEGLQLTTAESCTGGGIAQAITAIAGSSQWFERGFVTYSNQAKQDMLGVSAQALMRYGAVSEQVAIEMAQGALQHSRADISVAVTGIAGPDGGTKEKPVGTVWLAWADKNGGLITQGECFLGNRCEVRHRVVERALQKIIEYFGIG